MGGGKTPNTFQFNSSLASSNQTPCFAVVAHIIHPDPKVASIIGINLVRGPPCFKTSPSIRRLSEQFLNLSRLHSFLLLPTSPSFRCVACDPELSPWIALSQRLRIHPHHLRFVAHDPKSFRPGLLCHRDYGFTLITSQ